MERQATKHLKKRRTAKEPKNRQGLTAKEMGAYAEKMSKMPKTRKKLKKNR